MSETTPTPKMSAGAQLEDSPGILLYYKYVPLHGHAAEQVANFFTEMCSRLCLTGRIRVARDGVNVTVGGSIAALRAHIDEVTLNPLLQGGDIDFKLAASGGSRNEATRSETKMDRLVVRQCEELVTLGPLARHRADPRVSTAPHLTPDQFHEVLRQAAAAETESGAGGTPLEPQPVGTDRARGCGNDGGDGADPCSGTALDAVDAPEPAGGEVILLDARNIYETRIGHFDVSPRVPTLDPQTRCFSDLPAWLDAHEAQLRNRTVLMYCTGGVRCERASAYLREKGPEFSMVFQLSGGIQRYLERFPDGGFFRGKNFLYDDRIAVGPQDVPPASPAAVVGRCLMCGCAWDDYGARLRCSRCRLLLLVCETCTAALHRNANQQQVQEQQQQQQQQQQENLLPDSEPRGDSPTAATRARRMMTHGSAQQPHLLCELCSNIDSTTNTNTATTNNTTKNTNIKTTIGIGSAATYEDGDGGEVEEEGGGRMPGSDGGSSCGSGQGAASPAASPATGPATTTTAGCCGSSRNETGGADGREPPADGRHGATEAGASASHAPPAAARQIGGLPGADTVAGSAPPRRLRILCLHGFRQTGKQFQGRTCALRKKLRDLADFVFVDAPHTLPFFVKASTTAVGGRGDDSTCDTAAARDVDGGVRDGDGSGEGAEAEVLVAGLEEAMAAVLQDGGLVSVDQSESQVREMEGVRQVGVHEEGLEAAAAPPPPVAAKRAWLLPPELYGGAIATAKQPPVEDGVDGGAHAAVAARQGGAWQAAPSYVDELQYMRQTEGWAESLAALKEAVRQLGPFDGVFGFSQGASIAAVLCALQQQYCQQKQQGPEEAPATHYSRVLSSNGSGASSRARDSEDCDFGFRFAILASGFPSPLPQHRALMAAVGPLELPSLHVYGSGGGGGGGGGAAAAADSSADCGGGSGDGGGEAAPRDRQIAPRESEALAAAFSCEAGRRRSLCHQCGHLIPATKSHAATFRSFLAQSLMLTGTP